MAGLDRACHRAQVRVRHDAGIPLEAGFAVAHCHARRTLRRRRRDIEIGPGRRLVVTWQHQLNAEMRAEGFSRLTYEFRPKGDAVSFQLTHEIGVSDSNVIQAASSGWPMILSSLKSLPETVESLAESLS